jgi:hypothetical protein
MTQTPILLYGLLIRCNTVVPRGGGAAGGRRARRAPPHRTVTAAPAAADSGPQPTPETRRGGVAIVKDHDPRLYYRPLLGPRGPPPIIWSGRRFGCGYGTDDASA